MRDASSTTIRVRFTESRLSYRHRVVTRRRFGREFVVQLSDWGDGKKLVRILQVSGSTKA